MSIRTEPTHASDQPRWDELAANEPLAARLPWEDEPATVEVPTPPLRRRRLPRFPRFPRVAWLVIAATFAGFLGGSLVDRGAPLAQAPTGRSSIPAAPGQPAPAPVGSLEALYASVSPSVVQLSVSGSRTASTGSGVIVDTAGIVVTNNHVIDGASTVQVTLSDGRALTGEVAGVDPQWDLAVVRLNSPPSDLVVARLGDSDDVVVGQAVAAIGAPFGLQGTLTSGIVSAIDRVFAGDSEYPAMRGLIQTDASINPGNSGGPLFNMAGEVIGITTAIESPVRGSVGVGFAVPINQAQRGLPALVSGETVKHPFLGIGGDSAPDGGVEVNEVIAGTSAAAAGLQAGDIITAVAGKPVDSVDELAAALDEHAIGDVIELAVTRDGKKITVNVKLRASQGG